MKSIRITEEVYHQLLAEKKKKRDRCLRIADRKYDKPSAYKSGAVVRCRQGEIWKGLSEDIDPLEAIDDKDAIRTVIQGKRKLGFITVKASEISEDDFWAIVMTHKLKIKKVEGNPLEAYIYYVPDAEKEAEELKQIAEKYGGFLAYNATKEDSKRIGELLGYKKESIEDYIKKNYADDNPLKLDEAYIRDLINEIICEDESLHKWFSRKGASGKSSGWVDCNTCRKVDGKTKCKSCGREKGETRSKYPSCRPTPGKCKDPGKGKTWGKTK